MCLLNLPSYNGSKTSKLLAAHPDCLHILARTNTLLLMLVLFITYVLLKKDTSAGDCLVYLPCLRYLRKKFKYCVHFQKVQKPMGNHPCLLSFP